MARPRLFDGDRAPLNVYLHMDQRDKLVRLARERGLSPSALVRGIVDALPAPTGTAVDEEARP